ncbi:hypothetical protein FAGAP_6691 [Fusarium agapanthi]|uniref:DJ-1/PfpI domain-containing protein n=1 Tax=Fusarium agapanthi TaxID=1803897 RepID=A0A9P5EDR7_9HYPO|nr:hypothetical protein FAGAP_6691 [Fusarium agapanthi]
MYMRAFSASGDSIFTSILVSAKALNIGLSLSSLTMSTGQRLLIALPSQVVLPTRANTKTGWYLPELVHPCNDLDGYVELIKLESFLGKFAEYVGIVFVGGYGPMFDHTVDPTSHALIHGIYMVQGQTVTGFSNAEEDAYEFTDAMPFLLEDKLKEHGGQYKMTDQLFNVKVVTSGKNENLITGQNPPSARVIGKVLLQAIQKGVV